MPSRRDAIAPTVERILTAVQNTGLSPEQRENLAVAAAEALSNAAVHGNRLKAGRAVWVRVAAFGDGRVVVNVADSGRGFDVGALSDPTQPSRLLSPGGRGVFLMRRLMDRVEYNRAGNRVRLTLQRGAPGRRR